MKQVLTGVLRRLSQRQLSAAFNRWVEAVQAARSDRAKQARMARLLGRVMNRSLAVAFDGWALSLIHI